MSDGPDATSPDDPQRVASLRPSGPTTATRTLGRLAIPVYLPIIAGTFGLALLLPVFPLYLTESGMSLRLASIVLAAVGVGATIGAMPAGALIARFGERRVMFASLAIAAVSTALLGVTTTVIALVALRLATGAGNVGLRLSRQTYITRNVGTSLRGRAMSLVGGSFRMSLFLGPLVGGILADTVGFTATFAVAGVLTAVGLIPPLIHGDDRTNRGGVQSDDVGLIQTLRSHWRLLALAGVAPLLVMTVREGRYVVVPLIGDELGLTTTAVGALVAVGTMADLLLFPVAGFIMDHVGRLAAMVPAFSLIAVGLVLLGTADTTGRAIVGGVVMGIGNGLSSGSLLTVGSDLAPDDSPGAFLAALATLQDGGKIAGPLVVGFVGSAASLGAAAIALAGIMVVAILWLVLVLGETSRRPSTELASVR